MDAIDAIMTRRSVRRFTGEPVTDAELEVLLRAAMAAPSATNERPWRFVVVRDRERLALLARRAPLAGFLKDAPAAIVVLADRTASRGLGFWVIDCAAAIQNLLLAAHATGLGGVWIGVHPIGPLAALARRSAGAPRRYRAHSIVAIGHPAKVPEPVDRFEPDWVRQETW